MRSHLQLYKDKVFQSISEVVFIDSAHLREKVVLLTTERLVLLTTERLVVVTTTDNCKQLKG